LSAPAFPTIWTTLWLPKASEWHHRRRCSVDGTPRTGQGDLRVGLPVARCSVAGRAASEERLLGNLVPPLLLASGIGGVSGNGVRRLRSIRRKIGLAIEQGGCFLRLDPKTGAISSSGHGSLSDRAAMLRFDSVPSRAAATGGVEVMFLRQPSGWPVWGVFPV
jgi:hypothetical protein